MFRSLRSRLLALFTVIVVLSVGPVALVAGEVLRRDSEAQVKAELRREAIAIASLLETEPKVDPAKVAALTGGDLYYTGERLTGPAPERAKPADDGGREKSVQPLTGLELDPHDLGTARYVEWTGDGDRMVGYAARVERDGRSVGAIVAARRHADLGQYWEPVALSVGVTLIGTLLAAWLIGLTLAHRITRPLERLARATRDIALGRYNVGALDDVQGEDEIAQLAGAFRDMAVRLREVDSRDRQFLMSVSHELRTPLTAIEGHAQALEDGLAEDPESRNRSLRVIRTEANRLERLVEDIIDLARLRSNRFNTVSEQVLLDELGSHLMAIFQEGGLDDTVQIHGDFEHVAFASDGQRILQILRNLINNAMRYAKTEVRVVGRRERQHIAVRVVNDGAPVPEKVREQIFEPFVGSKREGGMGLGLAIGRELAWALGGNLEYVPDERHAIFELTLPLEPPGSGR